ncbi:MAG: hypothetical protein A2020_14960 [Lentisphaerae bacterium GWF2_45_14]|nr:MAG: hypothetical protein A2020_14960 [Lentisphaerae bacterium GWF2_45_14]
MKAVLIRNLSAIFLLSLASCTEKKETAPDFDSAFAFKTLQKLVAFGARPAGSENNFKQAEFIARTAMEFGAAVEYQEFTDMTPEGKKKMINITAEIKGGSPEFIVAGCHFDTKKFSSPSSFNGANDGASGTAVLLAAIKAFKDSGKVPRYSIRFVFFDGEECLYSYSKNDGLHGSRYYVKTLEESGELKKCKSAIIVDMVGDKELVITLSRDTASGMASMLFDAARSCEKEKYVSWHSMSIYDDHVPFQQKGIPSINLIDFNFGPENSYWHSPDDNLSKVSSESLNVVGRILLCFIYKLP